VPERQILSMVPRQGAFAEYIAIPAENLVTSCPIMCL
jgi:NADPH:quinone reductase-like Zn-dependent oxidoreductase